MGTIIPPTTDVSNYILAVGETIEAWVKQRNRVYELKKQLRRAEVDLSNALTEMGRAMMPWLRSESKIPKHEGPVTQWVSIPNPELPSENVLKLLVIEHIDGALWVAYFHDEGRPHISKPEQTQLEDKEMQRDK